MCQRISDGFVLIGVPGETGFFQGIPFVYQISKAIHRQVAQLRVLSSDLYAYVAFILAVLFFLLPLSNLAFRFIR